MGICCILRLTQQKQSEEAPEAAKRICKGVQTPVPLGALLPSLPKAMPNVVPVMGTARLPTETGFCSLTLTKH